MPITQFNSVTVN